MLNMKIGNNVSRETYIIDENTTVRAALEQAGVDYSRGMTLLDGSPVQAGGLDRTFRELGYDGTPGHDRGFLTCVTKVDNANG